MGFLNICLTLIVITTGITAENVEFLTVYRYLQDPSYSAKVTTELHRLTNGLGLPLRNSANYFIDSVEGMPSLECSPATAECKWIKYGDWNYTEVDLKDDELLSIKLEDERFDYRGLFNSCDTLNGGCQMMCSMQNGHSKCSCVSGLSLQSNVSCKSTGENTCHTCPIQVSTPGKFEQHLRTLPGRTWYFIPPGHTSQILNMRAEGEIFVVEVSELARNGKEVLRYSASHKGASTALRTGHIIKLKASLFSKVKKSRFRFRETTDYGNVLISGEIKYQREHLQLREEKGSLTFNITPIAESTCVSVIFMNKGINATVELKTEYSNGTVRNPSHFFERQIGSWIQRRFHTPVDNSNRPIRLILDITGRNTTLYSILSCSPYGNIDTTIVKKYNATIDYPKKLLNFNDSDKCFHGGKFNEERMECDCLTGFMGDKCREGCGENYYGKDCTSVCSDFRSQCKGMVFCNALFPCHCGPGYKGNNCTTACEKGRYGVNCQFTCGNCKDSCDIYTGLCHSGCETDQYYPPFCVSTYKYPDSSPEVLFEDLNVVTISTNASANKGDGNIKYYQAQYREVNTRESSWVKLVPQKIRGNSIIKANITSLSPGRPHQLRIIFIDRDGNSYQGDLVPFTTVTKTCSVPSTEFSIFTHSFVPTGFQFNWTILTDPTDCPITGYSVVLQRNWHIIKINTSSTEPFYTFKNLLPGSRYTMRVQAITNFGYSFPSKTYHITTQDERPSYVTDLKVLKNYERELNISWSAPRYSGGTITEYLIKYECKEYMACSDPCDSSKAYFIPANETSTVISNLRPHAVYIISVAAFTKTTGPLTQIQVLTNDEEPGTAPRMNIHPVTLVTNTSATLMWSYPDNCTLLHGFVTGYRYECVAPNNTIVRVGYTENQYLELDNLTPTTTYRINVYVVTTGGWNQNMKLCINFTTKASVPEAVQSLTVYKRGREKIGLRWKLPANLYGTLRGFSVSYCETKRDCASEVTTKFSPLPCSAWPDYFCYDINNLLYNTTYTIVVRAGNMELDKYGAPASVQALTTEGVPDPPLELSVVNRTDTSVTIRWKPPFMMNGILRSFLINLEHQDSANSTYCCEDNLLREIFFEHEQEFYLKELNGLSPASTYIIGISSRTRKISASTFLSINTEPSVPMVISPILVDSSQIEIPEQEIINNLTSVFILVMLSNDIENSSVIHDLYLKQKIDEILKENYYLVNEYNAEDLPTTVDFASADDVRCGAVGFLGIPSPLSSFRVGLLAVVDYKGAKSVGFASIRKAEEETSD